MNVAMTVPVECHAHRIAVSAPSLNEAICGSVRIVRDFLRVGLRLRDYGLNRVACLILLNDDLLDDALALLVN